MQASTQDNQSSKRVRKQRDLLQTVLLVVIVIGMSLGVGYFAGFQMGKKEGARLAVEKVTDFINPLNAISNNPLFPSTVIGKVKSVESTSVTVALANGESKTVVVSDKTVVTKGDKTLGLKDVQKGGTVTILTQGKGSEQTAKRIVIR